MKSFADFKNIIRKWEQNQYDCKLCKDFVPSIGYINRIHWFDFLSSELTTKNMVLKMTRTLSDEPEGLSFLTSVNGLFIYNINIT